MTGRRSTSAVAARDVKREDEQVTFEVSRTLGFGHCDPAGIAYFPSYFDIMVEVMEEIFAALGSPWPTMMGDRRIGVPTVKLDVDFTAPSRHGDRLDFAVRVARLGRSSLELHYRVTTRGRPVWTARQVIVAISLDTQRAVPWPDDLRAALAAHLETADAHDLAP